MHTITITKSGHYCHTITTLFLNCADLNGIHSQ